jgi:hypothetical protein
MYIALVVLLMLVLPVLSIAVEMLTGSDAGLLFLVGKWFVFWAVGVRLFTAGVHQLVQPGYTSGTIFRIADPNAEKLVTEIGFGNLSIGLLGLLTIVFPAWIVPAALAGGLFYLLAGIKHVMNRDRTSAETIPLVSDLGMGILLAIWLALMLL